MVNHNLVLLQALKDTLVVSENLLSKVKVPLQRMRKHEKEAEPGESFEDHYNVIIGDLQELQKTLTITYKNIFNRKLKSRQRPERSARHSLEERRGLHMKSIHFIEGMLIRIIDSISLVINKL